MNPVSVFGFEQLPAELQTHILQFILEPKNVAQLNLVSKSLNFLNKASNATLRIEYLFNEYKYIVFDPNKTYSYNEYIRKYSCCDFSPIVLRGAKRLKTIEKILSDDELIANSYEYNFALNMFIMLRPAYKLLALLHVILNSDSQKTTRDFYGALPGHMRRQIEIAIGENYDQVLSTQINGPLVLSTIKNYLLKFGFLPEPANE